MGRPICDLLIKRVMSGHSQIVSRLNVLTCLIKQVVFGLALNRLGGQAGRIEPNPLTQIASPNPSPILRR